MEKIEFGVSCHTQICVVIIIILSLGKTTNSLIVGNHFSRRYTIDTFEQLWNLSKSIAFAFTFLFFRFSSATFPDTSDASWFGIHILRTLSGWLLALDVIAFLWLSGQGYFNEAEVESETKLGNRIIQMPM